MINNNFFPIPILYAINFNEVCPLAVIIAMIKKNVYVSEIYNILDYTIINQDAYSISSIIMQMVTSGSINYKILDNIFLDKTTHNILINKAVNSIVNTMIKYKCCDNYIIDFLDEIGTEKSNDKMSIFYNDDKEYNNEIANLFGMIILSSSQHYNIKQYYSTVKSMNIWARNKLLENTIVISQNNWLLHLRPMLIFDESRLNVLESTRYRYCTK